MKEKKLQEVCRVWRKKFSSEAETSKSDYGEKFYNEINSLAFSSGMKLKTKVQMISQVSDLAVLFRSSTINSTVKCGLNAI